MKDDIFGGLGGLGGLMKGFAGLMPQDDPNVKLLKAQSDLNDLRREETEIYAEIGKQALLSGAKFPELENRLRAVQANLTNAQAGLEAVQAEKTKREQEEKQAKEQQICPQCGYHNLEGVKFCQECGTKLGALKCRSCGATLAPGTRFCGECGTKQDG